MLIRSEPRLTATNRQIDHMGAGKEEEEEEEEEEVQNFFHTSASGY